MLVILDHVLERCRRSVGIEGAVAVRNSHIEDSSWTNHTQVVGKRSKWIFGVLDEVIGDDEVHRRVGLSAELLTVIDDVDLDELLDRQLWIVAAQAIDVHAIDIAHQRTRRNPQRTVQGAHLQAAATQVLTRQSPPPNLEPEEPGRGSPSAHKSGRARVAPLQKAHRSIFSDGL
jgi:hypothetical protein